jgi:hypothetical protein
LFNTNIFSSTRIVVSIALTSCNKYYLRLLLRVVIYTKMYLSDKIAISYLVSTISLKSLAIDLS